jgi:hypothetical protein
MTDEEKLMYKLIGKFSDSNVPLVFKGALITKLILVENGYSEVTRTTNDIDGHWTGTPLPTMDELVEMVNQTLREVRDDLYAVAFRKYAQDRAAGIDIIDKNTNRPYISIDINITPVGKSRIYKYNDIDFKGVLPNEILADKIFVLSGHKLFRRSKDIVDAYTLSHCLQIQTVEIFDICKRKNNIMDTFSAFYTQKANIEHAYNKLVGIKNKPSFDEVYSHLTEFIRPFAEKDGINSIWDNVNKAWNMVSNSN